MGDHYKEKLGNQIFKAYENIGKYERDAEELDKDLIGSALNSLESKDNLTEQEKNIIGGELISYLGRSQNEED